MGDSDTDSEKDLDFRKQSPNGSVGARPKEIAPDRFGFIGGSQYTNPGDHFVPVDVLRKRELKWLDMLDDWDKWMSKKPKKVKDRCRKGIPSSLRSRAWQRLCGSTKLMEKNKLRYKELDEMEGDSKWVEIINKDLDRQFPFHEMFQQRDGHGQQDLYRILKAYSIYNPRDGYCQAQAPVAAVLLMHMPAEEAFWCLVQICDRYLTGYYSPGLEAVQVDGEVLFRLLKKVLPATHKHMKVHNIDPILYMTEWFMCLFARTLPWPSVLRVWDVFLFEGVKVLFRVALVVLKYTLGTPQQLKECPGLYETMLKLKNIPAAVMHEEFLSIEMLKLKVFDKDMEGEHSLTLARRKAIRNRQLSKESAADMLKSIEALKKQKKRPPKHVEKKPSGGIHIDHGSMPGYGPARNHAGFYSNVSEQTREKKKKEKKVKEKKKATGEYVDTGIQSFGSVKQAWSTPDGMNNQGMSESGRTMQSQKRLSRSEDALKDGASNSHIGTVSRSELGDNGTEGYYYAKTQIDTSPSKSSRSIADDSDASSALAVDSDAAFTINRPDYKKNYGNEGNEHIRSGRYEDGEGSDTDQEEEVFHDACTMDVQNNDAFDQCFEDDERLHPRKLDPSASRIARSVNGITSQMVAGQLIISAENENFSEQKGLQNIPGGILPNSTLV